MKETTDLTPNITGYPPVETLSYEQAFQELEEIVSVLENNSQTLDKAMELFERGQEIARYCTSLLDKAELKVQVITSEGLVDFPEV
jgi:exodeoxyribonuclease VII small subunit